MMTPAALRSAGAYASLVFKLAPTLCAPFPSRTSGHYLPTLCQLTFWGGSPVGRGNQLRRPARDSKATSLRSEQQ